eukprot:5906129-Lingulodinium_polyedra.AAC.1
MEDLARRVAQQSHDEREGRAPRNEESVRQRRSRLGKSALRKATRGALGKALKTLASDGGWDSHPISGGTTYPSLFRGLRNGTPTPRRSNWSRQWPTSRTGARWPTPG